MVMPGRPPATIGLVTEPGIVAPAGGVRPNDCCTASDVDCDHEMRDSFTIVDDSTLRPAADERVGLDRLVAERRRAGAVDDAAEGARNLARAVRVDVAAEDAVAGVGLPVAARQQPVGVVDQVGACGRSCWRPAGSAAARGAMIAAAYGSMRSAGIVLFGERQAGHRIRTAVVKMPARSSAVGTRVRRVTPRVIRVPS